MTITEDTWVIYVGLFSSATTMREREREIIALPALPALHCKPAVMRLHAAAELKPDLRQIFLTGQYFPTAPASS